MCEHCWLASYRAPVIEAPVYNYLSYGNVVSVKYSLIASCHLPGLSDAKMRDCALMLHIMTHHTLICICTGLRLCARA